MARLDNLDYEVNGVTTNYEIVPEIAPLFNATTAYAAGDQVIQGGVRYKFTTAHPAGAWTGTDAEEMPTVADELTSHGEDITELKADYNQIIGTYKPTVAKEDGLFIDPNGNESPSSNSCASGYIPVIPGQKIYLSALKLTGTRSICGYKENKAFVKRIVGGVSDTEYTYTVEDNIYYVRATGNSGTAPVVVYADLLSATLKTAISEAKDYAYIATDGNDTTGDGSATLPFATVDRALQSGATNILIKNGVYNQYVNLNSTSKSAIRLINASMDSIASFIPSGAKIADSESLETGYTKVYSADTDKTIDDNNLWIYQDGVPDATTAITASERHPAQKGRGYRCLDTKIVKCSATSLSDALTEIEESDQYKWFLSSGKIYFSRPDTVSASHPICVGEPYPFFTNVPDNITVELYGISLKYFRLNLEKMKNAKAVDCWVTNIFGSGAFTYNSRGTTLIRCEASCCVNGGNGDGFNGAAGYTGDADAPQATTMLIDCWAHDNRDDGYSDHNRSDAVLRGGLYEYNVKAGVTPSYGENCACYGVMSRHNVRGFLLTGQSTDGSKSSCLTCYDCIADNNTGNGNSCGFSINASGGNMILYNCVALNSPYGFRSETGSNLTLINCGTVDIVNATGGSGTITIKNALPVS